MRQEPDLEVEEWEHLEDRWVPVREWVERQVARLKDRLGEPGQTPDLLDLRFLQGQIEALRSFGALPKHQTAELEKRIGKDDPNGRKRRAGR